MRGWLLVTIFLVFAIDKALQWCVYTSDTCQLPSFIQGTVFDAVTRLVIFFTPLVFVGLLLLVIKKPALKTWSHFAMWTFPILIAFVVFIPDSSGSTMTLFPDLYVINIVGWFALISSMFPIIWKQFNMDRLL